MNSSYNFRGVKSACSNGFRHFARFVKQCFSKKSSACLESIKQMPKQVRHDDFSVVIPNLFRNLKLSIFKRSLAFTLAETLIVMGVIGIVAALTLPNLNQSTNNKEKVAKVKKVYSNFEDALGRAKAVYGPLDEWFNSDNTDKTKTARVAGRLTEFMKLSKSCGNTTTGGCMNTGKFSNLLGTNYTMEPLNSNSYSYILADGTSLAFSCGTSTCNIYIDIDGPNKGKFLNGVDVFDFVLEYDTSDVIRQTPQEAMNGQNCRGWSLYCIWWVLGTDNMDYVKLNSSGKCPDGTTTLDGVSNITCN